MNEHVLSKVREHSEICPLTGALIGGHSIPKGETNAGHNFHVISVCVCVRLDLASLEIVIKQV